MAAADRGEAPRRARRRFTAEEKADFVRGYDAAPQGQKGAFLRSNGLYSSHIENWRKAPAKQAKRAAEKAAGETARLRAENEALKAQLEASQRTVATLGKAFELLEAISESSDTPRGHARS